MDWKISLDRYLTTPPDDGFDSWCENVCEKFSDSFYAENEDWCIDSDQCNKWLNTLFNRDKEFLISAMIIERAFKIYLKK